MVFPIAGGNESKGYEISNSLRLNDDDSAYLSRTNSSGGDRQKFTTSFWIKRSNLTGNGMKIFDVGTSTSTDTGRLYIGFFGSNTLAVVGGATTYRATTQLFRDPSAWYHIVVAVDSTDGTADNRVKIYVNGNQVTAFDTNNAMTQNQNTPVNESTKSHQIGRNQPNTSEYYDGYITEFHHIDGQQLAQTNFGEFDDNGVWVPIKYTGTYGTNGVFLQFKQTGTSQNSSGIGADTSGNDNHFAVTNLAATDVTEDTCTNNFCTLSPLAQNTYAGGTLSEGNCEWTSGVSEYSPRLGTFGLSSGKWYWEIKPTLNEGSSNDPFLIGISSTEATANSQELGHSSDDWAYYNNGKYRNSDSDSNYGDTYTVNDIIGVALDLDNSKLYFSKNGTFQNSGDPTSGSTGTGAISITSNLAATNFGFYFPALSDYDNSSGKYSRFQANFGNPPFAISSGNTDGKYGNFEYAVPSGYYAICTKRLAEFG